MIVKMKVNKPLSRKLRRQYRIEMAWARFIAAIINAKVLVALSLIALTLSARAELGETPRQFEPRQADRSSAVGDGYTLVWVGKTLTHTGWFYNSKACVETFWYNDHRKMTGKMIAKFMQPYDRLGLRHKPNWEENSMGSFIDLFYRDGTHAAIVWYDPRENTLSVWYPEAWVAFGKSARPVPQVGPSQSAAIATETKKPKNDCMIVASEIRDRMKDHSQWNGILQFKIAVDGQSVPIGHAVACWKYSDDGHVYAGDDDGTIELNTSSTNPSDILNALSVSYSATYQHRILLDGHFAK